MMFGLENLFFFGKISDFYYTTRFSTQNGEIRLQKYPTVSGEVSITNYSNKMLLIYKAI